MWSGILRSGIGQRRKYRWGSCGLASSRRDIDCITSHIIASKVCTIHGRSMLIELDASPTGDGTQTQAPDDIQSG